MGRYALNDYKGAADVYQTYLTYQPYLPAVHNNLGQAYEAMGDDDAAEKAYLAGLETFSGDGSGILLSNLAAVCKRQGIVDQAVAMYESGINLPAEGHHNLGLIYAERGLWDQSLKAYGQALDQAPDMTIVYFSMAGVRLLKGDDENASRNYETFLDRWEGTQDYVRDARHRLRQIYPVMGDRYLRGQHLDEAGSIYERLLLLGDESPEVWNNLVLISGRLKKYDKAQQYAQLGLERHPQFFQLHLSLATVYEHQGDRAQALEHYRTFLGNIPQNDPLARKAQKRVKNLRLFTR